MFLLSLCLITMSLCFILQINLFSPKRFWSVQTLPQLKIFDERCISHVKTDLKRWTGEWINWPEQELENTMGWTIIPLFAFNTWLPAANHMSFTKNIVNSVPGMRTALFSRLRPGVRLTPHRGYAFLANHVLRCHIVLECVDQTCYVEVNGRKKYANQGDIIVFDDSLMHTAGNEGSQDRIVLILDVERPPHVSKGTATVGKTIELVNLAKEFGIQI